MNRIFGSSASKAPKPSLNEAIQSTESRIENLELKIRKLDAELMRYKDSIKQMKEGAGKGAMQQRAMRVLKQKKMYEDQLTQLQQQNFNMEQAVMTTENLRNTMATVNAMKVANKEMTKQYRKINIDEIEAINYDMEDLIEQANEVQESLGRSYGVPDEIDEDELQAELDALGDDIGDLGGVEQGDGIPNYLKETGATSDLPTLPSAKTPVSAEPVKAT